MLRRNRSPGCHHLSGFSRLSALTPSHQQHHCLSLSLLSPSTSMGKPHKAMWKVDKILDVRRVNGKREYLVKWLGWEDRYNSWEPESHLTVDMRRTAESQFPATSSQSSSSSSATIATSPLSTPTNRKRVDIVTPVRTSPAAARGIKTPVRQKQESPARPSPSSLKANSRSGRSEKRPHSSNDTGDKKTSAATTSGTAASSSSAKKRQPVVRKSVKPGDRKRGNYLSWDEYFMAIARLSADRSKDPVTQVGACIVNPDKRIVGIGYNGMPIGCSDDVLPWRKHADNELECKYTYVCHAEMNAVMNKNTADLKGCTMYVDLLPCNECAKIIIQSGIQEVVFLRDKYPTEPKSIAARTMLDMAGVKMRAFESGSRSSITISLDPE